MKGLKKLALASAVAAAPFAQAELTAMDDALLGEMTGQAGITIDVDLDMSIDAIKYVDQDGVSGVQGAITASKITLDNDGGAATIRGVTIDADGSRGLVIGLGQVGDTQGNGIDINVGAVLINNGNANLTAFNALNPVNEALTSGIVIGLDDLKSNNVGALIGAQLNTNITAAATADPAALTAANSAATAAVNDNGDAFTSFADAAGQAANGDAAAATFVGTQANPAGGNNSVAQAAMPVLQDASTIAGSQADLTAALTSMGAGNIGGFRIENFRNYIQDDLVGKYNGVFDMALQNSVGGLTGVSTPAMSTAVADASNDLSTAQNTEAVNAGFADYDAAIADDLANGNTDNADAIAAAVATEQTAYNTALDTLTAAQNQGRFVQGEIVINGTGNAVTGTAGLQISGKFGGAIDKAAWVDEGAEFGVADLGFFHGVDTNGDDIADTIEGMHFSVNIDVVDHTSWNGSAANDVAALQLSNMSIEGTIMMGDIYLSQDGNDTGRTSLGSVLVKDIDMTGTKVWVYGH